MVRPGPSQLSTTIAIVTGPRTLLWASQSLTLLDSYWKICVLALPLLSQVNVLSSLVAHSSGGIGVVNPSVAMAYGSSNLVQHSGVSQCLAL